MQTLPDWLDKDLRIVSVGINPSIPSARAGFPFANPRNRFWKALNVSGLVAAPLEPGVRAMDILLTRDRIGFTDVVKRATAMEKDVSAAEFRAGAEHLFALLQQYRPALLWLHGKTPLKSLCRAAAVMADDGWGMQSTRLAGIPVFVTPNPSPANAAFSLEQLIEWYKQLANCVDGTSR